MVGNSLFDSGCWEDWDGVLYLSVSSYFPYSLSIKSFRPIRQFIDDISPFFGFVPEEELTLRQFRALCFGAERVPGHRGGNLCTTLLVMATVIGVE